MNVRGAMRPSTKQIQIEIVASKQDLPIPVVNGKSLHSRYDPAGESTRWVAEKLSKKLTAKIAVVLGVGFAYHIQALRKALGPAVPIVVFEPITEMVTAYAARGGQNIENVTLWPNPTPQDVVDGIAEILRPTMINHVAVLAHPPSIEMDPAHYQSILNCINSSIDMICMSLTTGWGFGFEWIENAIRNIRRLPELPFLNQVTGEIQSAATPPAALVVGAGPSLDDGWDVIRRSQVLKLAVDTALEPLEHNGIIPHLGFLMDSQVENARLVENINSEAVNLVTTLEVHPSVFERRWNNLFVAGCDEGILSWLEKRGKFSAGSMKQGGSVATCAFDLARQTGCSPIYFGGIDLSFSKIQAYCRGTAHQRRAGDTQNRFRSPEQIAYKMKSDRLERTERGFQTQENMYNYYRWLKDEIGRTTQPVILLKKAGLLTEFLPADGEDRILKEKFPAGFRPEIFQGKFKPNGAVSREFLEEGLGAFRRELEGFLNPNHFSDPDTLEAALRRCDIFDVLKPVVEPAITTRRYEIEKGIDGDDLLKELRDKLANLMKIL